LLALPLCFMSCDNASTSETGGELMADPPNLAGAWVWNELVTDVSSLCADEIDNYDTNTVTIAQDGAHLTLTGLIGLPSATLHGAIYAPQGSELARIKLSGNFSEDGGTTTAQEGSWVKVIRVDSLQGVEIWHWAGGGGSCTGSTAITAKKLD